MVPGLVGPREWYLSDLISFYVVIKLTLILKSYGYMNVVLSTCKMYKAHLSNLRLVLYLQF
jgi:hypothetical protein